MSPPAETPDYDTKQYLCQDYEKFGEWLRCGYDMSDPCPQCKDLGFDHDLAYEITGVLECIRKGYHLEDPDERLRRWLQDKLNALHKYHGQKDHVWAYVRQAASAMAPGWQLSMVEGFACLLQIDSSLDGAVAASHIDLKGGVEGVDEDPLQKDTSMNDCKYRSTVGGV
jgi:hypothetical protein